VTTVAELQYGEFQIATCVKSWGDRTTAFFCLVLAVHWVMVMVMLEIRLLPNVLLAKRLFVIYQW